MALKINPLNPGLFDLIGGSGATPGPAQRHVVTFNNTTDWGSPSGGFYSIAVAVGTHGKGVNPTAVVFEDVSGTFEEVTVDQILVDSLGNLTIKVPETPDLRFAGKLIII